VVVLSPHKQTIMATNVVIEKNKNENNGSIMKRFTRKVQEAGVIPKLRSIRYDARVPSRNVRKTKRLKSLDKKAEIEHLIKMGKMSQIKTRRRR